MAEGGDSAGMSGESTESVENSERHRKGSKMAVDGGGSCAAADSEDIAPGGGEKNNDNVHATCLEKADALKAEGNELFKQHQYAEAVAKYTAAIDAIDAAAVDPRQTQLHVYLCNRAFAHLRMENFGTTLSYYFQSPPSSTPVGVPDV